MRISDWSSDVCSSDLRDHHRCRPLQRGSRAGVRAVPDSAAAPEPAGRKPVGRRDRKSVESGKSVSVRVDLGGCRIIKKNKSITTYSFYITKSSSTKHTRYHT